MRTQTDVSGEWSHEHQQEPRGLRLVETPGQGAVDLRIPAEDPVLLGRAPGPRGIAVQDPRISSVHLTVYPGDDGALWFRDMGSKNGTFLNGQRGLSGPLAEGDVLRIGSTLLVVTRRGPADDDESPDHQLVGQSPSFREMCARARTAAKSDGAVLLLGETGTGKEGLAGLVHRASARRGPLITVNCAVLTTAMAGAALFGHERGAFTGADAARKGFFREARGGTLFLDEIGDLPLDVQAQLLRALEQHEITPVGASRPLKVDARVVAATNVDLAAAVAQGTFRADLFARLSGWVVRLPPLRERREDILRLARFFVGLTPARVPYTGPLFEPALAELLLLYDWQFNVRELRQTIERLSLQAAPPYAADRLPKRFADVALGVSRATERPRTAAATRTAPLTPDTRSTRRRQRPAREALIAALEAHGYNIAAVARAFDRDRKQVYRWIAHYGIDIDS